MQEGWEERFSVMQAEAREKAEPRPGERLHGLDDLLANLDLPDGTQMTDWFMDGLTHGWRERQLLEAINAYIEFPNILRRKTTRDGERWHGLSEDTISKVVEVLIHQVREASPPLRLYGYQAAIVEVMSDPDVNVVMYRPAMRVTGIHDHEDGSWTATAVPVEE